MSNNARTGKDLVPTLFLSLFTVAGIIIIAIAFYGLNNSVNLDKNGVVITGIVDKIEHVSNADSDCLNFTIKFIYEDRTYFINNLNHDMNMIYSLKQQVNVRFISHEPERAVIDSHKEKYQTYVLVLMMGMVSAGIWPAIEFIKWFNK